MSDNSSVLAYVNKLRGNCINISVSVDVRDLCLDKHTVDESHSEVRTREAVSSGRSTKSPSQIILRNSLFFLGICGNLHALQ